MTRPWRVALFLSGLVLLSQAFPLASPVRDAATLAWAPHYHLVYPDWHLVFTPFCSVADALTMLSYHQDIVLVIWFFVLAFGFGGIRRGLLFFGLFMSFIVWGVLTPRPMGRLVPDDAGTLLIDFHSHTQFSHDGRPSFTPEANRQWHWRQGYGASFITDHNRIEASQIAKIASRNDWRQTGYRSLEAEEVSLKKTHLVILGNHERVDNRPYDSDFAKIPLFVTAMHKKKYPVIASLPEYWFYHWGEGVQDFVRWGWDSFRF